MSHNAGDILKFIQSKEYQFQKSIGQGGTGKTILIKDPVTEFDLICKKYAPMQKQYEEEFFSRFIDEIKIMYPLYHKNIVRIYNYYLYPEYNTGYILMEYVDGMTIEDYFLICDINKYESLFIEMISAFKYLESEGVLHRDIRNNNIMVTLDGHIKVIDFGFGKKIQSDNNEASILLNWPVTDMPSEIKDKVYDHTTEVYFVGKLYEKLLYMYSIDNFKYDEILRAMTEVDRNKRIESFDKIEEAIYENQMIEEPFSHEEKSIYQDFANAIMDVVRKIKKELELIDDLSIIEEKLKQLKDHCLLEDVLQDNSKIVSCFIRGAYSYSSRTKVHTSVIKDFIKMYIGSTEKQKRIILFSIHSRLRTVPIEVKFEDDDLPF